MRIGELPEHTSTPRRLLRYYEEQSLISAARCPNGYRDYDDYLVDRALQIRGLQLLTAQAHTIITCDFWS